jgi:transposase
MMFMSFKNKKILQDHIDKNQSMSEISKLYEVTPGTIFYWLRKFQIKYNYPIRNRDKPRAKEKKLSAIYNLVEDKDWMKHQYTTLKKTSYQIAKELGVSQSFIQKTVKKHGIPPHPKGFANVNLEFFEKIKQQKRQHIPEKTLRKLNNPKFLIKANHDKRISIKDLSKKLKVSQNFVKSFFKENNIEIKPVFYIIRTKRNI